MRTYSPNISTITGYMSETVLVYFDLETKLFAEADLKLQEGN
jgi:hypothetical protein